MKTAFLFPGQGSQSVGMMNGLAQHAEIKQTFDEASAALGEDLWKLVCEGPAETLNQTTFTQPAMLAADIATWRVYLAQDGEMPAVMAGHSLGEIAALVAAGALDFTDAVKLTRFRAEAMQNAVPEGVGAMAAVLGLDDDAVRAVCAEAAQGEVLEPVNLNSPGQVVIAGNKAAVERGMALAKEKGAKRALPLPVSVPSHSSLMQPAADKFRAYLESVNLRVPSVPVLQNADVQAFTDTVVIKDALARQLHSPVRWVETVQALAGQGIERCVECGPGKVLAGLVKRINDIPCVALVDDAALQTIKG
ncbi:MAG: ACP S-malonyltransferase [Hydrogenophilaceae bacterium]|nr:ACP S-malonyltransferase [Hydrogenophilaceae bacterium]